MTQQRQQQLWKLPTCFEQSLYNQVHRVCLRATNHGEHIFNRCFFDRSKNAKTCQSVKKKEKKKKKRNVQNHNTHKLILKSNPFSLRSPRCDDLWFTFVNTLLLCVTFCFYSSLAFPGSDAGCLSLRGQLPSDLPVSLNKRWQSIFAVDFLEVLRV